MLASQNLLFKWQYLLIAFHLKIDVCYSSLRQSYTPMSRDVERKEIRVFLYWGFPLMLCVVL